MASICVFCGSHGGAGSAYTASARELGQLIASRRDTLIYGGGSVGLMGTIADAVLAGQGNVVGVIPHALARAELMHPQVSDMRIVPDMHVRKATMHQLADGYIALPGGYGTMEELFEVLCWRQLDFHSAPVAILNLDGFYDGLIQQIGTMVSEQFLSDVFGRLLAIAASVSELESWLTHNFQPT